MVQALQRNMLVVSLPISTRGLMSWLTTICTPRVTTCVQNKAAAGLTDPACPTPGARPCCGGLGRVCCCPPHLPALPEWRAESQRLVSCWLQTSARTQLETLQTWVWTQLPTKKCDAVRGAPLLLRNQ